MDKLNFNPAVFLLRDDLVLNEREFFIRDIGISPVLLNPIQQGELNLDYFLCKEKRIKLFNAGKTSKRLLLYVR